MRSRSNKKDVDKSRDKPGGDADIAQKNARSYARRSPQGSTGQQSKHDR